MKIGYIRVSTEEQNTLRQEEAMASLGVDKVYIDKMSGKSTDRPQLRAMLDYAREGDTIIVDEFSRLARSTKDLLEIVETMSQKGVSFISRKESIDTTSPQGKFMLTVFAGMAEFERSLTLQRQREGIEIAKREGRYTGRKPIDTDTGLLASLYPAYKAGTLGAGEYMKRLGLKPNTFYRRLEKYEQSINSTAGQ